MQENRDRQRKIHIGDVYLGWTVIGTYVKSNKDRKWLCRCVCGTERYVSERSLLYGGSQSCGCAHRNPDFKVHNQDLAGRRIGSLKVLCPAARRDKRFSIRWLCECSCGNVVEATQAQLLSGSKTHCGCKERQKRFTDITGRRFDRLTALFPLDDRDARGSKLWHCRCDCGTELDVAYNTLLYSNTRSCGCKKKECDQTLNDSVLRVAGTSISHLQSKKIPSNNSTGVRGVVKISGGGMLRALYFKRNNTGWASIPRWKKRPRCANRRKKWSTTR